MAREHNNAPWAQFAIEFHYIFNYFFYFPLCGGAEIFQ